MRSRLDLYLNTIRYLKAVQVWSRITLYVKKILLNKIIASKINKQSNTDFFTQVFSFIDKPTAHRQVNLKINSFTFLNQPIQFDTHIEWNKKACSKLWLYNLHYFNYLLQQDNQTEGDYSEAKNVIEDWINSNPIGYGIGWEPYPLSLRIVNWIYFYCKFEDSIHHDEPFHSQVIQSIYQQCHYLTYFIEYNILANHLFSNLKALIWAGAFYNNEKWLKRGIFLLKHELAEQVLLDGGHYERSPMYHGYFLIDLLDLIQIFQSTSLGNDELQLYSKLKQTSATMMQWLETMIHPDGKIALFGDSSIGECVPLKQIKDYFNKLIDIKPSAMVQNQTLQVRALPESGYFVFQSPNHTIIIDGGELGVRYQPGHAHCDMFSFEYSIGKNRFIVDSGIGEYLPSTLRNQARSVYSHNVSILGRIEQADFWGAFRMGRRISSPKVRIAYHPDRIIFEGDYHSKINRKLPHTYYRSIEFNKTQFVVTDRFEVIGNAPIESLIHLHPLCGVVTGSGTYKIIQGETEIYIIFDQFNIQSELREWFYIPSYGEKVDSKMIVLKPNNSHDQIIYVVSQSTDSSVEAQIALSSKSI
ncbi:alginate lyase family protein [candidate division KSB1 bacterium]|nr:alginate lyase family protein [candidate division KSB1 bacterium]